MLRILFCVIAMTLFAAAGLALLSFADQAAADGTRTCANAVDDDGDTNVNDGCPTVGSLPENPACVNAIDDDAADDPVDTVNDGCPAKDAAEVACADAVDDDADTRVNDGCATVGSLAENPACANNTDDDAADDGGTPTVNDGCPVKGGSEATTPSVGGIAELPDSAQSPASASDSSAGAFAALAAGLATAVLALSAGACYARRRWVR